MLLLCHLAIMHSCSYNIAWLWIPNEVENSLFLRSRSSRESPSFEQNIFPFLMHVKSVGPIRLAIVYPSQCSNLATDAALSFGLAQKISLFCLFPSIISTRIDFDDLIFKPNHIIMQKASAELKFNSAEKWKFSLKLFAALFWGSFSSEMWI